MAVVAVFVVAAVTNPTPAVAEPPLVDLDDFNEDAAAINPDLSLPLSCIYMCDSIISLSLSLSRLLEYTTVCLCFLTIIATIYLPAKTDNHFFFSAISFFFSTISHLDIHPVPAPQLCCIILLGNRNLQNYQPFLLLFSKILPSKIIFKNIFS